MKKTVLVCSLFTITCSLFAAPLRWVCNWPEASSQTFALYQGETAEFEPIFKVNGKAVTNVSIYAVWYQTNGMDQAWWKLDGNVFAPSNDVGAASYRFFVESRETQLTTPSSQLSTHNSKIYRANGTLRMLPSPGYVPNAIAPPVVTLDFASLNVLNAPWLEDETDPTVPAWAKAENPPQTDISGKADKTEVAAAAQAATIYTDSVTNSLTQSLSSRLSQAAQASTNYTDEAIAAIPAPDLSGKADKTKAENIEAADYWTDNNGVIFPRCESSEDGWMVWGPNGESGTPVIDYTMLGHEYTYFNGGSPLQSQSASYTGAETEIHFPGGVTIVRTYREAATVLHPVIYGDALATATNSVSASLSSRLSQVSQAASNYTDSAADALSVDLRRHADMIQAISNESQVVYRLFSSSNVIDEVTNYNSAVNIPTRRLYMLTNTTRSASNYVKIWDESRRHEATLAAATNFAKSAVVDYAAPKGWSATTSGLGSEAPSNTTWISTPTTVFAGGLEYAKFVHTGGEVWVLCGNGMMQFDPDTNAYFRISADDGTDVFSIEKTDAVTVGADADSISVAHEDIYITVRVVSATAPTMYWTTNLLSGATVWHSQSELGQHYDVHWTDLSDYDQVGWKLRISTWLPIDGGIPFPPSMFFKFSYERPGSTKIVNSAVTDVQGGILCTDGVHKVRPVYNNGSVTWEVISE